MKTCVQYRALIDAIENIFYCFFFLLLFWGRKFGTSFPQTRVLFLLLFLGRKLGVRFQQT